MIDVTSMHDVGLNLGRDTSLIKYPPKYDYPPELWCVHHAMIRFIRFIRLIHSFASFFYNEIEN
jgi:hypothetical protein